MIMIHRGDSADGSIVLLENSKKIYQNIRGKEGSSKPDMITDKYMFRIMTKSDPSVAADHVIIFNREVVTSEAAIRR
jgi:hypothetical protein